MKFKLWISILTLTLVTHSFAEESRCRHQQKEIFMLTANLLNLSYKLSMLTKPAAIKYASLGMLTQQNFISQLDQQELVNRRVLYKTKDYIEEILYIHADCFRSLTGSDIENIKSKLNE
ncbi:MAG: hypothetical protein AB7I27_19275 [Bacteriovoracaceae bacterium]